MPRRRKRPTVERKVHFYRADIGVDDGGIPLPFDPKPALRTIRRLPFSTNSSGPSRYADDTDGNALCVIPDTGSPNTKLLFCRVRRTGLPQLERAGSIRDMMLGPDTGLLESVHVVFFSDNIVGADYNHFGPRISRLGRYLYEKSSRAIPNVRFLPLLRDDAAAQLNRLGELRVLEISIRPAYLDYLRRASQGLWEGFKAQAELIDDPDSLQLVLKSSRGSRRSSLRKLIPDLRRLLSNNELRSGAEKLSVRGKCMDTNRVETVDLLKDKLISTKSVVRMSQQGRALDPDSTFRAIEDSYEELYDSIQYAAAVSS